MLENKMPAPFGLTGDTAADRARLKGLMGKLPDTAGPITSHVICSEDKGPYTLETLLLDLNGLEPVPAYFIKPKTDMPASGFPTIVFDHSHGGRYTVGKDEILESAPYMHPKPYAEELAAQGIAAIAIDHWAFGKRATATESAVFKEMLWRGMVMWGMMVFDSMRAVDYLAQRPDVDAGRLGTLGMSMGSTMAWWLAALDERVRVCIDICCLTDFDHLIIEKGLDLHGIYYYVPDLLTNFSASDINALIAPRPHLSLDGTRDKLTPTQGLTRIDGELKTAYAKAGAPENWRLSLWDVGHEETPGMRTEIMEFLSKHL